jgi:hypothetical protein
MDLEPVVPVPVVPVVPVEEPKSGGIDWISVALIACIATSASRDLWLPLINK